MSYKLKKHKVNESENKTNKINIADIKSIPIKDRQTLLNIINKSKPNASKDSGFWLFDEAIKKDNKAYTNINKPPFYIKYMAYVINNDVAALCAFSTEYYNEYDTDKENFKDYVRIIDFQVDSKYKGNNLQKICTDDLEKRLKKLGFKGTTLTCYKPSLVGKYKNDGYTGDEKLMYKTF